MHSFGLSLRMHLFLHHTCINIAFFDFLLYNKKMFLGGKKNEL